MVTYDPDLNSEYVTGDQAFYYRRRRGARRAPSWAQVEAWRRRWTRDRVETVLDLIGRRESAEVIGEKGGFGTLQVTDVHGRSRQVPDLRGLDVILVPPERRSIQAPTTSEGVEGLDLSYWRLEGARLTDLDLSDANLYRASLQKATLRRTRLKGAILTKAHLEDADLRDAVLDDAHLGAIRYTEDSFWWRGTVLMETHFGRALYVDPVLERCARDQYYLYVLKYRNRHNILLRAFFFLWWITSDFGRSAWLWASWSILLATGFACLFYLLGENAFATVNLEWNFQTMIYYSVVTFTTLGFGDVTPKTQTAAWCVTAEVIVGYVMLGGLISILATKIAQRS